MAAVLLNVFWPFSHFYYTQQLTLLQSKRLPKYGATGIEQSLTMYIRQTAHFGRSAFSKRRRTFRDIPTEACTQYELCYVFGYQSFLVSDIYFPLLSLSQTHLEAVRTNMLGTQLQHWVWNVASTCQVFLVWTDHLKYPSYVQFEDDSIHAGLVCTML